MEDSPLKELNEKQVNKLSDREFKIMVIRLWMPKELSENHNSMKKEIETINKNQEEMKNTIPEIKNTVQGVTSRLDIAGDQISELEDKMERSTQAEQLHKKDSKNMNIA